MSPRSLVCAVLHIATLLLVGCGDRGGTPGSPAGGITRSKPPFPMTLPGTWRTSQMQVGSRDPNTGASVERVGHMAHPPTKLYEEAEAEITVLKKSDSVKGNPRELIAADLPLLRQLIPTISEITETKDNVNGLEAVRFNYTFKVEEKTYKTLIYTVASETGGYTIKFEASADTYDKHLPVFEEGLKSFKPY